MSNVFYWILGIILAPGIILAILSSLSSYSKIPFKLLDKVEGLSDEDKEKAKLSFKKARRLHWKTLPYDCTAYIVMFFVLFFVKKEDDHLPKLFRKWENEVSNNGDNFPLFNPRDPVTGQLTHQGIYLPIPVEDTMTVWDEQVGDNVVKPTRMLSYWVNYKYHPRSWFARYVWLGWRNRASQASCDEGFIITDELKTTYRQWGNPEVGKELGDGKRVEGVFLRNVGEEYHLFAFEKVAVGHRRTNFGFKIGNVINSVNRLTRPAMVTSIGFSYRFK